MDMYNCADFGGERRTDNPAGSRSVTTSIRHGLGAVVVSIFR